MKYLYAEIIISIAHVEVDKIFHYKIPEKLKENIQVGMRVLVPFGANNKNIEGYVMGFSEDTNIPLHKMKEISKILDTFPIFDQQMLEVARWMKEKYCCTLSDCLQCIMPTGIQVRSEWIVELHRDIKRMDSGWNQQTTGVIQYLLEHGGAASLDNLEERFGGRIRSILKVLQEKKLVAFHQITDRKDFTRKVRYASISESIEDMDQILEVYRKDKKMTAQARILELLAGNDSIPVREIKAILQVSEASLQALSKKELIVVEEIEVKRDPYGHKEFLPTRPFVPTQEQKNVIEYIKDSIEKKEQASVLLHGVTGSGKTEVYLQLIQEVLDRRKQAIVLVPEISLTPQMVERFIGRFGERVAVTHSKLSLGERYDQWKKAKDGSVSIMIGPRSAIFTPFSSLGMIILDEEHESSYKSEVTPKYHTREVAQKRCEQAKAVLILGSATPAIESYYQTEQSSIKLLKMKERSVSKTLPSVQIIDMREELINGNRSIFSSPLEQQIQINLEKGEQTILFLNRRGHSTFISCRKCGYVAKCKNCNVSFTYHAHNDSMICHYCGAKSKKPTICPQCGSQYIKFFGVGTQKVEEEIQRRFPEAGVLRMDVDTTSRKHGHEQILDQFASRKADILIGTQMIAKGHDFPHVTLVGVLAADMSLHMEDYRAAERTFQLLTQVAGRAGRAELPGRVLIQSYDPEHYSIQMASKQSYEEFYEQEIKLRQQMQYPPFTSLFTILLVGDQERKVITTAFELMEVMKYFNKKGAFELLGPTPAVLSKIKNQYRWRILIKCKEEDRLRKYALYCVQKYRQRKKIEDIHIHLDMNPMMMV